MKLLDCHRPDGRLPLVGCVEFNGGEIDARLREIRADPATQILFTEL
jgi:hypothetical protein